MHAVTGVLKLFLRSLPDSLFPNKLYHQYIDTVGMFFPPIPTSIYGESPSSCNCLAAPLLRSGPASIFFQLPALLSTQKSSFHSTHIFNPLEPGVLRALVLQLPEANYNLAQVLFHFLYKMAKYSDVTSMDSSNIAIVFGPNVLINKQADDLQKLQDTPQILKV